MMVKRQESDEIEQITKSSHWLILIILFAEEKIAYVTQTFNNKIYADSTEIRVH